MRLDCSFCDGVYEVSETLAGQMLPCPNCETTLVVPTQQADGLDGGKQDAPSTGGEASRLEEPFRDDLFRDRSAIGGAGADDDLLAAARLDRLENQQRAEAVAAKAKRVAVAFAVLFGLGAMAVVRMNGHRPAADPGEFAIDRPGVAANEAAANERPRDENGHVIGRNLLQPLEEDEHRWNAEDAKRARLRNQIAKLKAQIAAEQQRIRDTGHLPVSHQVGEAAAVRIMPACPVMQPRR